MVGWLLLWLWGFLEVSFTFHLPWPRFFPFFSTISQISRSYCVSWRFLLPTSLLVTLWLYLVGDILSLFVICLLLGFTIHFLAVTTIVASIRMAGDYLGLVPGPFCYLSSGLVFDCWFFKVPLAFFSYGFLAFCRSCWPLPSPRWLWPLAIVVSIAARLLLVVVAFPIPTNLCWIGLLLVANSFGLL